jgi:hypothetical protein
VHAAIFLLLAASGLRAAPFYGFNMPCWGGDCYAQAPARESLPKIAATGARWVVLTPTCYMRTVESSEVECGALTPTDESLRALAREAKVRGLSVALKPHVDCPGVSIRGLYRPSDRARWFASYRAMMRRYARLASEERLDLLVVGTELASLATIADQPEWTALIAETRAVFPGPLTFAADWYAVNLVTFWRQLDYIGVDGYFPQPASRAGMSVGWLGVKAWLAGLAGLNGKPVLFTEFGLTSQEGASHKPMNFRPFGPIDLRIQAEYFDTFLTAFEREPWFAGLWQWDWDMTPGAGGPQDYSMSVQGKPALGVLERHIRAQSIETRVGAALGTIKLE